MPSKNDNTFSLIIAPYEYTNWVCGGDFACYAAGFMKKELFLGDPTQSSFHDRNKNQLENTFKLLGIDKKVSESDLKHNYASVVIHEIEHEKWDESYEFLPYKKQLEYLKNQGVIPKDFNITEDAILGLILATNEPGHYVETLEEHKKLNPDFDIDKWLPGGEKFNKALSQYINVLEKELAVKKDAGSQRLRDYIEQLKELKAKGYDSALVPDYRP